MTKTKVVAFLTIFCGFLCLEPAMAQNTPTPTPTPKVVTSNSSSDPQTTVVSRERRQQAYAKMLEGQRYYLTANGPNGADNAKLAKQAFQKAVELDPTLSEGYTALAELALAMTPIDIEESTMLASIAVKINPDNFGAHRILSRIYTIKSHLSSPNFDSVAALKAISEWKELTRLDPRNAEAWAFLSEFYNRTEKSNERIQALQNWMQSSSALDARFYRGIMGPRESLATESAALKLGTALIKANRSTEAVEVLSRIIADNPDNTEAIDLLKLAVDNGTNKVSNEVLEALQQAVFANPSNTVLIELLAQVQTRSGKIDDAAKSLRASINRLATSDKTTAANLQISLGDLYAQANRYDDAIAAYEAALKMQGIGKDLLATDDEREFAMQGVNKLIQVYKNAERLNEAKATIERSRALFGNEDLFADYQMIALLRETGRNQEALQIVHTLRNKMKDDYGLLRLEASLLTGMGRVEEGVGLIKALIGRGKTLSAPSLMYDDFGNYIFISGLYNQAKRGKEAADFAQQAYAIAGSDEKKQLANLSLASAQQTAGDYKGAEGILRNLLKQTPSNPIALNNLGYFLLERNENISEALNLIQQAVQIDPTNSSYLDSLGWAYFKLGKLEEAENYLKEAINNDATSASVYEHLGDVYQKQGKAELARAAWQKAINFSSDTEASNRIKSKLASKSPQ